MFCYEYSVMSGNVLFWTLHNILKCFVSKANYGFLSVDWESRSLTMGVRSDYFQTSINIYQIIRTDLHQIIFFFNFRICLLQWGLIGSFSNICHISISSEQNVVGYKSCWIGFFFSSKIIFWFYVYFYDDPF